MRRLFQSYVRLLSVAALILSLPMFCLDQSVMAQHEGHVVSGKTPGTSKPKAKPAARRKSKRKSKSKRKRKVSARNLKARKSTAPATPAGHTHTPDMVMPSPVASPTPGDVSGMPAQQHDAHLPEITPLPSSSPGRIEPVLPATHPPSHLTADTAQPVLDKAHDSMEHTKANEAEAAQPDASPNRTGITQTHAMGPLLVMSGDYMSVRVGSSETNLMPMGQMGSGTSWTPVTTPLHMIHKQSGDWLLMFHYNAIVGMNSQGGPRGVAKFESANWIMPMAFRKLGKGTLQLRGMFSLEPFTFPPGGSPLLFQTGETYKGRSIIDAQHPHDLFMELSAQYTHPLGENATWFAYIGCPGEPALGPTAFMHRASASENPAAALSHHLQDSSHISFGVLTTGLTYRWFKLEGSVFNGREPDENRYNFDAHRWNSRSARLSFAPNSNWSMQVSHGFLRDPEAQEPGDVRRTTASISYNRPFDRGNWASSLIWGRNHESHSGEIFNLNGYVAESTVNFLDKNYLYTRLELVDKNAILRDADRLLLGITDHHPSFRIGAYTFGGVRDIWGSEKISVAVGSDITFYSKPSRLDPIYGQSPASYRFFLRFRSGKMTMMMGEKQNSHDGMKH